MIAKEPFVAALNAILERERHRHESHKHLEALGIEILADPLEDAMVTLLDTGLEANVPRGHEFVSWWLYDCSRERDKQNSKGPCMQLGRKKFYAKTPEQLYDMVVAYKNYEEAKP